MSIWVFIIIMLVLMCVSGYLAVNGLLIKTQRFNFWVFLLQLACLTVGVLGWSAWQ